MRPIVVICATLLLASITSVALSAINLQVENEIIESSSSAITGDLDIFFNVTPGDTSPPLAGYDVVINFTPIPGVVFGLPLANVPGRLPVLLPGQSTFGTTGTDVNLGRIRVTADANPGFDQTIDSLDGLIRIPFTVAPNTIGSVPFTIDASNADLADSLGNPILFTPINGGLTIVPEPSSLLLCILGLIAVVVVARRLGRPMTATA